MLVLTRKKNESLVIDGEIVITIVEITGNRVRLGIEAPRKRRVHRGELVVPSGQSIEVEGTVGDDGTVTLDEDITIDDDESAAAA